MRTRWWYIAALMVTVGIALLTVSIAAAQKPRPEKLWDAYPLDPEQGGAEPADPAPTPTSAPVRGTGAPSRPASSEDDGGGVLVAALIGGAAFVVGLGVGEVVRRRRRATVPPALPPPEAPRPQRSEPVDWVAPVPSRPEPRSSRRGRFRGWPEEAARAWTCEIDWKPGYIRSGFRAMVAPPGEQGRKALGQSRSVKWTLMGEAEPPTRELIEVLQELVTALTEHGWVRIDPGGHWYSQRFLWAGDGQPRPLAPLTGKEANV